MIASTLEEEYYYQILFQQMVPFHGDVCNDCRFVHNNCSSAIRRGVAYKLLTSLGINFGANSNESRRVLSCVYRILDFLLCLQVLGYKLKPFKINPKPPVLRFILCVFVALSQLVTMVVLTFFSLIQGT